MTQTWLETLLDIAIIAVTALVLRGILKRLINRWMKSVSSKTAGSGELLAANVLSKAGSFKTERQIHRTRTLGTMLTSLMDAVIGLVALFMILERLGVNIMPALASAGIGGIALGFGAQSLVKDIISGVFLMLEDQLGVGDYVDVGNVSGTVLALALRATRIRDDKGEIWYIRNGEIVTLGNRSQGWSSGTVEIPVSALENPQTVMGILETVVQEVTDNPVWSGQMLEPPNVLGLTKFTESQAVYGVTVKCPGNEQWALEREIRARATSALQAAGIQVALPTTIIGPGLAPDEEPDKPSSP